MRTSLQLLIVEDQDLLRNQLKIFFIGKGVEADASATAYGALAACRVQAPKVLLTDIHLPDMNGVELVQLVRREWPYVRIIAMSGEHTVLSDALAAGADITVQKPFRNTSLWELVIPLLA